MHKSAFASYVQATHRTHPSSEQAATGCLLRPPELIACHLGAALKPAKQGGSFDELLAFVI